VTEVTPHIVVRDAARAAEWYERALGARVGARVPVPDGRFMQIELVLGDSRVMIADEFPEFGAVSPLTLGGTYGALTITTDAVDELWERALAEGAQVYSPLQDAFWGERHGQILDPFGHRWGLAQHLEGVPQEELVRRAAEVFGGGAAPSRTRTGDGGVLSGALRSTMRGTVRNGEGVPHQKPKG
jgi:PhnB protein